MWKWPFRLHGGNQKHSYSILPKQLAKDINHPDHLNNINFLNLILFFSCSCSGRGGAGGENFRVSVMKEHIITITTYSNY